MYMLIGVKSKLVVLTEIIIAVILVIFGDNMDYVTYIAYILILIVIYVTLVKLPFRNVLSNLLISYICTIWIFSLSSFLGSVINKLLTHYYHKNFINFTLPTIIISLMIIIGVYIFISFVKEHLFTFSKGLEYDIYSNGVIYSELLVFGLENILLIISDVLNIQKEVRGALLVSLSIAMLVIVIYITLYKQYLENKLEKQRFAEQQRYLTEIENGYLELRKSRHDYKNLLLSLNGFLETNNIHEAQDYISKLLDSEAKIAKLSKEYYLKIGKIKAHSLRSLIFSKVQKIEFYGIQLNIEINENITRVPGNTIDTIRVVGILLDNAIEGVLDIPKSKITINIIKYNNYAYEFVISNTINKVIDLNRLMEEEYTTKHGHSGLGLSTILQIVNNNNMYDFDISKTDSSITFSLRIQEEQ
ncbi:GHKL domain-containing protein [Limosilactobacillus reuteri]|nr:GHKL domain-containing protein [Limosilactobacillus reuteri]